MQSIDWHRLCRQTLHLTWASLKSRYRKTFAGFIWVLLNPLVMFGVQSLVFKKFLRLDVPNFYLFLVSGLLPWIFLIQTIQMATPNLVSNGSLLRSFKFHPLILVATVVLDNFVNFFLSVILIIIPTMIFSGAPLTGLLYAPFCLIPFVIGGFSLSIFTSLLNVFFRDTGFVLNFFFSVLFFLTPVFYPIEFIPLDYRWMVDFNPLYQLIKPFRMAIYGDTFTAIGTAWLVAMAWSLGMVLMSFIYWRRKRNAIYINL